MLFLYLRASLIVKLLGGRCPPDPLNIPGGRWPLTPRCVACSPQTPLRLGDWPSRWAAEPDRAAAGPDGRRARPAPTAARPARRALDLAASQSAKGSERLQIPKRLVPGTTPPKEIRRVQGAAPRSKLKRDATAFCVCLQSSSLFLFRISHFLDPAAAGTNV